MIPKSVLVGINTLKIGLYDSNTIYSVYITQYYLIWVSTSKKIYTIMMIFILKMHFYEVVIGCMDGNIVWTKDKYEGNAQVHEQEQERM